MPRLLVLALLAALTANASEPAARPLAAVPVRVASPLAHISAATELADGRLVVSDQTTPQVVLIEPATGAVTKMGSAGAGPDQYVQPGGFYGGPDGTLLLLDRGQARVLVMSPAGTFVRSYSIAVKGVQSSSDADLDRQQLDAKGLAYFVDRQSLSRALLTGAKANAVDLIRFDAATQKRDVAAKLLAPEEKQISSGGGMTMSRFVIGSPADGWGVAPDGRIAVVRAVPYHVEWISPAGQVIAGPPIEHDVIPMTDADKQAFAAGIGKGASVGASNGTTTSSSADTGPLYAPVKPPFAPEDVIVSPARQVWVMRTRAFGVQAVTYDVFDGTGARVSRVEFPANSRVIGFGKTTVFVREGPAAGPVQLKRYKLP